MSTTEQNQHPQPTADQPSTFGRRALLGSGAALGAGLVVALRSGHSSAGTSVPSTSAATDTTEPTETTEASTATEATTAETTAADGGGDITIAQLAAGLEVLAVSTYQQALDAAESGALGEVPPAVGEYVTTALEHHQTHLDTWNTILTDGGAEEVTEPNATLAPVVTEKFGAVTDVAGLAMLALELETIASHTYLSAIPLLESSEVIGLAGSMQIIDQQHQSVLLFALGEYPVPEVFQSTDKAAA